MRNAMTPSPLKRESFASSSDSSCGSMSMVSSFDSSFGSSASTASTWDHCYTPTSQDFSLSRRQSSGSIDMDVLSSSRSSLTGSVSPAEQMFFPMNSMTPMNSNMLTSIPSHDSNFSYATPCGKGTMNPNMMNFDFPTLNMYNTLENPDYLCDMPALSFESSSPLPLGSSPHHYVDPSQTTFQPFCPATPSHVKSEVTLGSPLDDFVPGSRSTPTYIKHFMSPPNSYTPCRTSTTSSRTSSTLHRTPTAATLESSMALHQAQSTESTLRARKAQRKQPQLDVVAAGRFFCDFKGCKSKQQGFRRQEHLKRHKKTHLVIKNLQCCSCDKTFGEDRSDNFGAHVRLHTKPGRKNARTKFCLKAVALVAKWDSEKVRKGGVRKTASVGGSGTGRSTRQSTTLPSSTKMDMDMDFEFNQL